MSCAHRDQDLLFLVHGELSPLRRLRLQSHLQRCAVCRERYAQFAAASRHIATALRGPQMPPWTLPAAPPAAVARRTIGAASALVFALLLLAGLLLAFSHATGSGVSCGVHPPVKMKATTPCRPDLRSDACR